MELTMAKQYPIWNDVYSPDYANSNSKSFGCRTNTQTTIKIGTSSINSFDFLTTETKIIDLDDGTKNFIFYVDNKVVKEAIYNPKTKVLQRAEATIDYDTTQILRNEA